MNVFIVDSENRARQRLKTLLANIGSTVRVVGEAADGNSLVQLPDDRRPDLVLLDNPDIARRLGSHREPPAIVFVCASDAHALAAFELNAVDYLLKPVDPERLIQALNKARHYQTTRQTPSNAPSSAARSHICVRQSGRQRLIAVEDIRCFVADAKYTVLHTGKEALLISDSLKRLGEEFPDRLLRVHRNALVALAHIEALEKKPWGSLLVRLADLKEPLEVSRRQAHTVRRCLRRLRGMPTTPLR